MIGADQIKPQRAYEYKGEVVVILGICLIEKTKARAIIYKGCINVPDYPMVVNELEFANHATIINNAKEIEAIEKDKLVVVEENTEQITD